MANRLGVEPSLQGYGGPCAAVTLTECGDDTLSRTGMGRVAICCIAILPCHHCLEQVTGIAPVSVGWKPTAHLFRPNLRIGG